MSAELVIHGNHCGSTPNVAQSVNFSSSAFPSNITTVAQALDYCFENKVKVTTLSQSEYNALPTDQKNKGVYVINDAPSLTAATLIYDGEDTGLGSNVQDAIDTLSDNLTSIGHIESGSIKSGTLTKSAFTSLNVTFDKEYTSAPRVVATFYAASRINTLIYIARCTPSTSGFVLEIYNNDSSNDYNLTDVRRVDWIAIGV